MGKSALWALGSFVFGTLLCAFGAAQAGGLSTPLGEVVIENLQVGQTYHLKDLANLSMRVNNASAHAIELEMAVLVPDPGELRQGAYPIPSADWLHLDQRYFSVAPGGQAVTDMTLTIPDDDRYLGRSYQVMVWSRTVAGPGQGMALAYGLKSRIIFTTDTARAEVKHDLIDTGADAGFTLGPSEIHIDHVPTGRVCDVTEATGKALVITNPGTQSRTFRLGSRRAARTDAGLAHGFEQTPDPAFLSFSETEFTLAPGADRQIHLYLRIPEEAAHRGRNYLFVIHAETGGERVTAGVYSRLYASVQ